MAEFNYEKMGILVSMIVLVGVLGVAVVASGEFDILGEAQDMGFGSGIPDITSSTNTERDGFYDYCYRMGLDC